MVFDGQRGADRQVIRPGAHELAQVAAGDVLVQEPGQIAFLKVGVLQVDDVRVFAHLVL